jgi:hypothetical protein
MAFVVVDRACVVKDLFVQRRRPADQPVAGSVPAKEGPQHARCVRESAASVAILTAAGHDARFDATKKDDSTAVSLL